MPDVLRWGILSSARISRALIPAFRKSKANQLVAVSSRSEEKASALARKWHLQRWYGSYEALIEDPDIDAIYNPLPNHMHAEWTIKAAQAGKHVLCEKPFALSLQEVDAVVEAARQHRVVVTEAFMYRHHPQTLRVKQLIDEGAIGHLRSLTGVFSFTLDEPDSFHLDPSMGGGSIWDVGCYPISYARTMVGQEPESASAFQITGPSGVDMMITGDMHFPGKVIAHVYSSFTTPHRMSFEIYGDDGYILIPTPYTPNRSVKITVNSRGVNRTEWFRREELYQGEIEDISTAVFYGSQPLISLQDSRNNTAAILALLESAAKGEPVRLIN